MTIKNQFSHFVSVFQDLHLPEQEVLLTGYAALIKTYDLQVPLPEMLAAISHKHTKYTKNRWMMFTPRYAPKDSLFAHLVFALKYEGIDLAVLKALFNSINVKEIVKLIQLEPTGAYSRKIWFLYEWLQEKTLDLTDIKKGNFVEIIDAKLQYPGPIRISKRHRVKNNLPGVPGFCPTIRRTVILDSFINMNLKEKAEQVIGEVHSDILARAAAFLLLKDSKASFTIEGETPPRIREERWGNAIGQAGMHPLSHEEFLRLQEIVIADFRYIQPGYRIEGGFIGEHDRATGLPMPDHISARPQDLLNLMDSLIQTDQLLKESEFDPILAATLIAFGFVFIHPFEDGNGRIHRYLIHHVLAEKNFTPESIIFPISYVILQRINQYRQTLESYSRNRLKFIEWRPTEKGNVEVLNETINLYRYFDATKQAEFLYECIQETIEKTLPEEVSYLKKHDAMKNFITNNFDMPNNLVNLLIIFLNQGNGKLSKRARSKEFVSLTETEIAKLEAKYAEIFFN